MDCKNWRSLQCLSGCNSCFNFWEWRSNLVIEQGSVRFYGPFISAAVLPLDFDHVFVARFRQRYRLWVSAKLPSLDFGEALSLDLGHLWIFATVCLRILVTLSYLDFGDSVSYCFRRRFCLWISATLLSHDFGGDYRTWFDLGLREVLMCKVLRLWILLPDLFPSTIIFKNEQSEPYSLPEGLFMRSGLRLPKVVPIPQALLIFLCCWFSVRFEVTACECHFWHRGLGACVSKIGIWLWRPLCGDPHYSIAGRKVNSHFRGVLVFRRPSYLRSFRR